MDQINKDDGLPGMSLEAWLSLTGTSYASFARRLGVSLGYPRMLALGLARPSYELACIIEAETQGAVPVVRWYPPPPPVEPLPIIGDE